MGNEVENDPMMHIHDTLNDIHVACWGVLGIGTRMWYDQACSSDDIWEWMCIDAM